MAKPNLTKLLDKTPETLPNDSEGLPRRLVHKSGEVNISAYFPAEVKAALRQVQAKSGKNIKGCMSEALQMLFRKYNVPVTVHMPEE